jgi:hypothetical protein
MEQEDEEAQNGDATTNATSTITTTIEQQTAYKQTSKEDDTLMSSFNSFHIQCRLALHSMPSLDYKSASKGLHRRCRGNMICQWYILTCILRLLGTGQVHA